MPNEPGVPWHFFLQSRFVGCSDAKGKGAFLAIDVRNIQQESPIVATIHGLVEISSGAALPVVTEFAGQLNIQSRELSLQQAHPAKAWAGQISENGRVMVLREAGQAKLIHLVHEQTLAQLV
jgi:hypothetical protein